MGMDGGRYDGIVYNPLYSPGRYGSGLTGLSSLKTLKCSSGLVTLPVWPACAITCPRLTQLPSLTSIFELCAYHVWRPPLCLITTTLPQPSGFSVTTSTTPPFDARTSCPTCASMSIPPFLCPFTMSPYCLRIFPLMGQIKPLPDTDAEVTVAGTEAVMAWAEEAVPGISSSVPTSMSVTSLMPFSWIIVWGETSYLLDMAHTVSPRWTLCVMYPGFPTAGEGVVGM